MFWIKLLKKIIRILNSDIAPKNIAGGVALGSIIGLTPFSCLHNLGVFFLIIIFPVNITMAMLAVVVFGLIGYLTDPLAHKIGYILLVKTEALTNFWTSLYNMPIIPFTRFNNTVVLGSLVISLILFIPVFLVTKKFIVYYRANLQKKVENFKIVKMFKLSKIYNLYSKYK